MAVSLVSQVFVFQQIRKALGTEDDCDCELAPVRSQGLNRCQVVGSASCDRFAAWLVRLRHPDAVFFLNMTPVTALSGGMEVWSTDLLDKKKCTWWHLETRFLCRTYCWVFREDAAGSLQLRKARFKPGLFLFVLLVLRQRDWTALSQGRGAAISMLPSSHRCRVRLALGPNCEANPKIHSWALTWPHCRQAMETFKGLPIFWAEKPLPGLIVVNSPRQVTHQLPRFDLDSKAKFRLGRTLFDLNHLGWPWSWEFSPYGMVQTSTPNFGVW